MNKLNTGSTRQVRSSAKSVLRRLRKFTKDNNLSDVDVCDMGGFPSSTTWKWLHQKPLPSLHYRNEMLIRSFLESLDIHEPYKVVTVDGEDNYQAAESSASHGGEMGNIEAELSAVVEETKELPKPKGDPGGESMEELQRRLREQEFVLEAYRKGEL